MTREEALLETLYMYNKAPKEIDNWVRKTILVRL